MVAHNMPEADLPGMMRVAGDRLDLLQARREALGIFRSNLADLACSETLLLAAFAEPAKRNYIDLWTREPLPVATFADLLAVHLAHGRQPDDPSGEGEIGQSATLRGRVSNESSNSIARRLRRADRVHRLTRGEIIPALERALKQQENLARPAGEIDPVGALAWLREYRPHLVPSIFTMPAPEALLTDPKTIVQLMIDRHPEIRGAESLFKQYLIEMAELPPHHRIKRDTGFRPLYRELKPRGDLAE